MRRERQIPFAIAALWSGCACAAWTFNPTARTLTGEDGIVLSAVEASSVDRTIRLTGVNDLNGKTEIDLRAKISDSSDNEWSIVWISNKAFLNRQTIERLLLPDTIEIIGESAFEGASSLTTVEPLLPDSVTNLGQKAFFYAPVSGTLRLANPFLKTIPMQCFNASNEVAKLLRVDLDGSGVETIGQKAFMQQTNLVAAILPNELKTLDTGAFWNCYSLTNVTPFLPAKVHTVAGRAFSGAPVAGSLILSCRELLSIGANAFDAGDNTPNLAGLESVSTYKSGITTIDQYAFRGQVRLTRFEFSEELASLANYAFKGCTNLMHLCFANQFTTPASSQAFDGAIKKSKFLTLHVFQETSSWQDYICDHGRDLTDEEKASYASMHPGEKTPVSLVPYPASTSTTLAYVSYWNPRPGLFIIIR